MLLSSEFFVSLGVPLQVLLSFLMSLLLGLLIAPSVIKKLQYCTQPIRSDGPPSHSLTKKNTPTMGGLIIIIPTIISLLLFCNTKNTDLWVLLFTFISFAILGAIDDLLKLKKKNSDGLSVRQKLILQFSVATIAIIIIKISNSDNLFTHTHLFYGKLIDLGALYLPFAIITIVASSNAVNITDGLDGLVTIPIITSALTLGIIAYMLDSNLMYITLFCSALVGSCLSFLWFNAPPAKIFMGDLGSLSIGATLGMISVLIKHEMVFAITSVLFIVEALSVIAQVFYFKITNGKRLFLMAPIHHHFEKAGLQESTIVIRAWIVSMVFSILSLSLYLNTHK